MSPQAHVTDPALAHVDADQVESRKQAGKLHGRQAVDSVIIPKQVLCARLTVFITKICPARAWVDQDRYCKLLF